MIEGNVDKLVRQRMRGRGMSWPRQGAIAMLALLRHKQELHQHVFPFSHIPKPKKFRHCASKGKMNINPIKLPFQRSLALG